MRTYNILVLTGFLMILAWACSEDKPSLYDGLTYTVVNTRYSNTFMGLDDTVSTLEASIDITIWGQMSDKDRIIRIEQVPHIDSIPVLDAFDNIVGYIVREYPNAVPDTHYKAIDHVILPAGETKAKLSVLFYKTPDMDTLNLYLKFKVLPTEEIVPLNNRSNNAVFTITNDLKRPEMWVAPEDSETATGDKALVVQYLGDYSKTKLRFMMSVLKVDLTDDDFFYNLIIKSSQGPSLQALLQRELAKYNAVHPKPLTDEYGKVVQFSK